MLVPITLPLTPILEGAGHLVVDCEPMLADTPPPPQILKGVDRESCIWVTDEVEVTHEVGVAHEVKLKYKVEVTHEAEQVRGYLGFSKSPGLTITLQKYERTPLDIGELFRTRPSNNPWELCYVASDAIEEEDSDWSRIASTPGIYILGKRLDGFYEVVVDESYIPWLLHRNFQFLDKAEFEFLICYDPTQPREIEVNVYGVLGARRRSYLRFLENAFKAIWSRPSRGLKLCLRSIVPPYLETALEWAILSCDILVVPLLISFMSNNTDRY
jgi:hypothetical protein